MEQADQQADHDDQPEQAAPMISSVITPAMEAMAAMGMDDVAFSVANVDGLNRWSDRWTMMVNGTNHHRHHDGNQHDEVARPGPERLSPMSPLSTTPVTSVEPERVESQVHVTAGVLRLVA